MKKKISSEQELYIQVAAHGDAAAFFSMISSSLKDYFLKLCSGGDSVEESAQKVYEIAETLFKKLQHTHPDNFDHWLETEFSSLSHNGNSEHEVILDKNLFVQCEKVLAETQKVLFRVASSIKSSQQKKGMGVFLARHKLAATIAIILLCISIISIILYRYDVFRPDLSFFKAKQNTITQQKDTTTVVTSDTVKKVDSIPSAAVLNPPVQETKPIPPPPPKPRPRATYTPPPTTESEGAGAYQPSRTSSYDQTQQTVQSRSERVSQPSTSYSSQNQSSENTATSSYNSGTSTHSSQQSTPSQSQSSLETNLP